ncbi:MAG: CpaF/VirB11 family protein [Acidimicrobiia bacterium]|nr:CpaF/VirB11 family protein [Acidimicrobiia bacterium]
MGLLHRRPDPSEDGTAEPTPDTSEQWLDEALQRSDEEALVASGRIAVLDDVTDASLAGLTEEVGAEPVDAPGSPDGGSCHDDGPGDVMVDAPTHDGGAVLPMFGDVAAAPERQARSAPAEDLSAPGTLTSPVAAFLAASVRGRVSILVTGGFGSGKAALLNTLCAHIPDTERIVTIEDSPELQLHQRQVIRLDSRRTEVDDGASIPSGELIQHAMAMRPDRLVLGEWPALETLDLLEAMTAGLDGSLSTLNANNPRDALRRIEVMTFKGKHDLPADLVRELASAAIDLVVHTARLRDGSRRITTLTEVVGVRDGVVGLNDLLTFDFASGVDERRRLTGSLEPTGVRPAFMDRLEDRGITVPAELFVRDVTEAWNPGHRRRAVGG